MKKGHWTSAEDAIIIEQMSKDASWLEVVDALGGRRTTKQCRERWSNHLDPTLKKTKWTEEEDAQLVEAQNRLGNTWTRIAQEMPGRSENEVKNRWYSSVHKLAQPPSKRRRRHYHAIDTISTQIEENDDILEVQRLLYDVHLFFSSGELSIEPKHEDKLYAAVGTSYLRRNLHQLEWLRNTDREEQIDATSTSVVSTVGMLVRGVEEFPELRTTEKFQEDVSPTSFLAGFSSNPSPSWFGLSNPPTPPDVIFSP